MSWISVQDSLPLPEAPEVLLAHPDGSGGWLYHVAYYHLIRPDVKGCWPMNALPCWDIGIGGIDFTAACHEFHWRALPKPPHSPSKSEAAMIHVSKYSPSISNPEGPLMSPKLLECGLYDESAPTVEELFNEARSRK